MVHFSGVFQFILRKLQLVWRTRQITWNAFRINFNLYNNLPTFSTDWLTNCHAHKDYLKIKQEVLEGKNKYLPDDAAVFTIHILMASLTARKREREEDRLTETACE